MNIKEYLEITAKSKLLNWFSQLGNYHLVDKLTPYSDLYRNSISLSIGPPGTSKTSHFLYEMIQISESLKLDESIRNTIDRIFYVTDKSEDKTVSSVMNEIDIDIYKCTYKLFDEHFENYIEHKLSNENNKNKQTIIFCDDAAHMFNNKNLIKI